MNIRDELRERLRSKSFSFKVQADKDKEVKLDKLRNKSSHSNKDTSHIDGKK